MQTFDDPCLDEIHRGKTLEIRVDERLLRHQKRRHSKWVN